MEIIGDKSKKKRSVMVMIRKVENIDHNFKLKKA